MQTFETRRRTDHAGAPAEEEDAAGHLGGRGGGREGCRAQGDAGAGAPIKAAFKQTKAKAEVAELHAMVAEIDTALSEAQLVVHGAEQAAAEAERTAARAA